jgi:hypothetical protein
MPPRLYLKDSGTRQPQDSLESVTLSIMRDRRFEPRHPTNEQVGVSWRDETGVDQACTGILMDVSRSGARVRLERPVRAKAAVRVVIRDKELSGSVKSCVRARAGFLLGLEFDPEFQGIVTARSLGSG